MSNTPSILDSDYKYIDGKGNHLKSRTELSIAKLLSFTNQSYEYDVKLDVLGKTVLVDFKTKSGYIEVIDSEQDLMKYQKIRKNRSDINIMAIGSPSRTAHLNEMNEIVTHQEDADIGSIFLEDPSFAFDYAHILPLVNKCSILHGHTSLVMIELAGKMNNGLLMDFGEAKKIIKSTISMLDHKFFISRKYLLSEDSDHYKIGFDGPKGKFDLQIPKNTTYLLEGEATVENLSSELLQLLTPALPKNVESVGVYIYEGYNKGAHIVSKIAQR